MKKAVFRKSRETARQVNNLRMYGEIIGRKLGIRIVPSHMATGATDGKVVHINYAAFSDDPDALVLLKGTCKHEFGHVRYTDFLAKKPILKRPLALSFYRSLEDGRMEKCEKRDYPGMAVDIEAALAIMVKKGLFSMPSADESIEALVPNMLLNWVRSHHLGQEILEPGYKARLAMLCQMVGMPLVKGFLDIARDGLERARSTKDVVNCSIALEEYLKREQLAKEQQGQSSQGDPDNQKPDDDAGDDSDPQGDDESKADAADAGDDSDPQGDDESKSDAADAPIGTSDNNDDEGDLDKAIQALGQLLGAGDEDLPDTDLGTILQAALNDVAPENCINQLQETNPLENPDAYSYYDALTRTIELRVASQLEVLLESRIEERSHIERTGRKLSTRHLARVAASPIPRVFRQDEDVSGVSTAVSVLLDVSASMEDLLSDDVSRLHAAVASARAAVSAMDRHEMPCSLYFFGHRLTMVKHFDEAWRRARGRHWGTTDYNTLTGEAIEKVVPDLAVREEERKLLLLVTDGIPSDPQRTSAALQTCRSFGVETAVLLINDDEGGHLAKFTALLDSSGTSWIEVSSTDQLSDGLMQAIRDAV